MSKSMPPLDDDQFHRWMQLGGFAFMITAAAALAYRPLFDRTVTPEQRTLFWWAIVFTLIVAMVLLIAFLMTLPQIRESVFVALAVGLHHSGLLALWLRRSEANCQALQRALDDYTVVAKSTANCDEQSEKNKWNKLRRAIRRYLPAWDEIKSQTQAEYMKVEAGSVYDELLEKNVTRYESVSVFRYDKTALQSLKRAVQLTAEYHTFLVTMRDLATGRR